MGISPQSKETEATKSPPLSYANVAWKSRPKPQPQEFPTEVYSDITVETEDDDHSEYTPEQMEKIELAFEESSKIIGLRPITEKNVR